MPIARLPFHLLTRCLVAATSLAATGSAFGAGQPAAEPPHGPIHEAFLQPLEAVDSPGAAVPTVPPAPLHDSPPAVRPSAKTAIWISGYWAWDERAGAPAWVVGVWRVPPPGMRWVPGYWSRSGDEWRWVRGLWLPHDQPRLTYLPAPPPPQDEPELAQLDNDQFAVPGYWNYSAGRYAWKGGFKARRRQGWVWTPTRHVWTPAGSLLVPGYWDYELSRRGLLFAPLAPFTTARNLAAGSGPLVPTALVPSAAINAGSLSGAVAGARYGHYYLDPGESETGELTTSLSALLRSPRAALPLSRVAPESLPRIAQAAERVRLLGVQRARFEASAAGGRTNAELTLTLPPPAEPVNAGPSEVSPGESASKYMPGTAGRRIPGAGGRSVPGISGRTVPGVDTTLPGVVGPGRGEN